MHPLGRYTCLVHALGFTENPEYVDVARYGGDVVYAGPGFGDFLIERDFLSETSHTDASGGDLVFWFDQRTFKHAGIWQSDRRIESKWGTKHLCNHEQWEIPSRYGRECISYRRPTYEKAIAAFLEFAAGHYFFYWTTCTGLYGRTAGALERKWRACSIR